VLKGRQCAEKAQGEIMSAYDRPAIDARTLRPRTQLVHGGTARSGWGETSEALFLTQGFVYNSAEQAAARFTGEDQGYQYSRFGNPTVAMFEERIALLEGAEAARATATGMAAVTASLMGQVKAGDHVVASRALFGSCLFIVQDLLPRFGVESTLVDGHDLSAWKAALRPNTRTAFLESPTNPALGVLDIASIAEILHAGGATLVVDNVFATPMMQRPLELGADCVVYSATKHIDGQGRCLGGVILGAKAFIETHIHNYLRQTGPSMSPFNAWVLLKGLETLPLRVAQQQESAGKIADFLAGEARITRVFYPGRADHPQYELVKKQMKGGSTMVAFEVEGGQAEAFRFSNALEIIKISNNLGDAKSLITHPSTTTHQRLNEEARRDVGIFQGMLRLSIGLEDSDDLIDDLRRGLAAI
jgi:O-succinylhomoserine sulfhydrylase